MTKKELSQLYYLNKEITEDKRRLKELESAATNTAVSISGLPHIGSISNKTALAAEIADIRNIIEAKHTLCIAEYNRLTRYINSIEDTVIRQIITLRHISGLTWQQIAFSIGEYDEQFPRRKYNRFLSKVDENDERKNLQ